MKIFITIVSILCSLSSLSQAVAAKIDGAEMSAKLNKKQEVQVKGWKIVGNKQALKLWKVGVKDGKDVNALAIGRGVMLETKMSLPELVEKEQKIKGEWFGLLSVDAYSVKGSASIKLELVDKEGKKLYTQKFSTKPRDVMPRGAIEGQTEKGIRLLAALDSTLVKVLMEKDVVMKLSLDNSGVAVLSGVEVSRFNVAPTRKLENKPNGQCVVSPDKVSAFVANMPLKKIPGIGPKTSEKLKAFGFESCADVRASSVAKLHSVVGKFASALHQRSFGIDNRALETQRLRKSLAIETTLAQDIDSIEQCQAIVTNLYVKLVQRLEKHQNRTIAKQTVKIKFADFQQTTVDIQSPACLQDVFLELLAKAMTRADHRKVRLIGLSLGFATTTNHEQANQLALF